MPGFWRGGRSIARAGVLVAAVCAATVSIAHAQVIRLPGTVKDESGHPVRGAVVVAENPDQAPPRLTTTSNDKGQFGFIGIRRGTWTLRVDAPGFEPVQFRHQVGPGTRQPPLDVRLARTPAPAAQPLDGTRGAEIQQRIDRAEALATGGDLDAAISAWREILVKTPSLTTVYLRIGDLYERKPDVEQALASYRRLLEIEPDNDKARAAIERLGSKTAR